MILRRSYCCYVVGKDTAKAAPVGASAQAHAKGLTFSISVEMSLKAKGKWHWRTAVARVPEVCVPVAVLTSRSLLQHVFKLIQSDWSFER